MGRAFSTNRHAYRMLVGKPEGKRSLGRPRSNIKMDLREREGVVVWTGLIWLRIGTSGGLLRTR
jgi:hypothetical protein